MSKTIPVTSTGSSGPRYIFAGPGTFTVTAQWPGGRGVFMTDLGGDAPDSLTGQCDSADPYFSFFGFKPEVPDPVLDVDHPNNPFVVDAPACTITVTIVMASGKTATASYFNFVTND